MAAKDNFTSVEFSGWMRNSGLESNQLYMCYLCVLTLLEMIRSVDTWSLHEP